MMSAERIVVRTAAPWLTLPPYFCEDNDLGRTRSALRDAGFEIAEVDCGDVADERGLLTAIGAVLAFPDYYRPNWDALDDCLGDLMRDAAEPVALLLAGIDRMYHHHAHAFTRSAHLLTSTSEAVEQDSGGFQLAICFIGRWPGVGRVVPPSTDL